MTTRPSMGRRRVADSDEQDAYTAWRRLYVYTQRAGVVRSIKRKTHKRERREARVLLQKEIQS